MKKTILILSLLLVGSYNTLPVLAAIVSRQKIQPFIKSDAQKQAQTNTSLNLATKFIELLVKEKFSEAVQNFDSTMKAKLPPEELQAGWQSVIKQIGKYNKQVDLHFQKSNQYDIVTVTCEFEKANLDIKVVYNNARQIAGLSLIPKPRVAEYQPPAYTQFKAFEERSIQIGTGNSALPGTLTLPIGKGPFPVIVLVHGSGPNDRDETVGPNKPFKDLALGLASQGIAVLRYDKRTKIYPEVAANRNFTVKQESINDCLVAIAILRQMPKINRKKIFVLGHSLGGMLIPRIGQSNPNIAGLIIMAGNTRPLEDLILEQTSYLISLDGSVSEDEKKVIEATQQQIAKIKSPELSKLPATDILIGVQPSYWLDLQRYNPLAVAKQLSQPILILQGERDYQVTMTDFQGWKNALSEKTNVIFKSYPTLNHLFLAGKDKSTPDEYQIPGHVSEEVIKDITNWVKK